MTGRLRTITVAALIELLEGEDRDAKVIFTADYGDHHHTEQALPLRGEIDTVCIDKSAYSNSGWALADSGELTDDDEDAANDIYLVIR